MERTTPVIMISSFEEKTLLQVIVSLLEESQPSRVRAALSRDGVEVRLNTIITLTL